jgi:hypothetical protein
MGTRRRCAGRAIASAWIALAALALTTSSLAATASAAQTSEQELAERYAPLIDVQTHDTACGEGEPYSPAPVEAVLGQSAVLLRAADGSVIATGPTADDLAAAPNNAYLDLPGNALDPGCNYERWFDSTGMAAHPTVYARVASEVIHPGRLVVQYWVFWVYNDWNDRHEGDWEMLQLAFDSADAAAALHSEPVEVAVAQHEGSERREWSRVKKDGDHPVLYPGTGSHATYYSPNHWFGKSAASGFGCDDTRGPSTRITPAVVMMPEQPPTSGEFAWLGFQGRWGERQPTFNNGPTGPITKDQWARPITWMEEEGRDGSVSLPPLGSRVTDFFCSASRAGSVLFIRILDRPLLVSAGLLALVLLIVAGVKRTLWSPDLPLPLVARRRNGQILRGAARLIFEQRRRFASIMFLILAGGVTATLLQAALLRLSFFDNLTDLVGRGSGGGATLAILAGLAVSIPVGIYAHAASVKLAGDLDAGNDPRGILQRTWGSTTLRSAAAFLLLFSLLATFPAVAAVIALLWGLAPSTSDADHSGVVASFRRARVLGKGQRLRLLVMMLTVFSLGVFAGPFIGTMVLLVTDSSFAVVNLVSAVVASLTLPWMAVSLRLLHGDRVAAAAEV